MMVARTSQPSVSLEEFLEMEPEPGCWIEWCAGIVYAMSGGTPHHSRLGARVIVKLGTLLHDCTVFDGNADIWVAAAEFYGRADASVVCGAIHTHSVKRNGKLLGEAITNPEILVEVLSASTESRDRGEKFGYYKQLASLRDYVLVSQDERRVEIRRRGDRGWAIEVKGAGESFDLHGHSIAVDEIYG